MLATVFIFLVLVLFAVSLKQYFLMCSGVFRLLHVSSYHLPFLPAANGIVPKRTGRESESSLWKRFFFCVYRRQWARPWIPFAKLSKESQGEPHQGLYEVRNHANLGCALLLWLMISTDCIHQMSLTVSETDSLCRAKCSLTVTPTSWLYERNLRDLFLESCFVSFSASLFLKTLFCNCKSQSLGLSEQLLCAAGMPREPTCLSCLQGMDLDGAVALAIDALKLQWFKFLRRSGASGKGEEEKINKKQQLVLT